MALSTDSGTAVQRSFRLSPRTLELLGERARETSETRNALVARLLEQGLRTDRHPLIVFRRGSGGRGEPMLVGTRLRVFQVVQTLRAEHGDVAAAARYLDLPETQVRACVDYYADFGDEVDADRDSELAFAARERERWERVQRVLG